MKTSSNNYVFLLIILASLFPLKSHALTDELTPALSNLTTTDNDTSSAALDTPNPLQLTPNWWKYFEGDNNALAGKIKNFLARLNEQTEVIESDQKQDAGLYIDRIKTSLNALVSLNKSEIEPPPESKPFKVSYTLNEVLSLERSRQELKLLYTSELPALKNNKEASNSLIKKINTKFAEYRKQDLSNTKKFISGLEIIANRLTWLVLTLKEPIIKNNLDSQDAIIKKLSEEVKYAESHLDISQNDVAQITKDIEQQLETVNLAKSKVADANNQTLEIIEDGVFSNFKSILLKQKLLVSESRLALNESKLHFLEAKLDISALTLSSSDYSIDGIITKYKTRDSFIKLTQEKNETWNSIFRKEIDSLISIASENTNPLGANDELIQILNQRKNLAPDTALSLRKLDSSINDLKFINDIIRNKLSENQGALFKIKSSSSITFSEAWRNSKIFFSKSLFSIGDIPVTTADILRAIIIILFAYFISRVVQKIIRKITSSDVGPSSPVFYTLGRLSHYLIILIGLMIALSSIGLSFTNIAIVAGALSVGIGFGLQSIVNNFVSGIIVLFEQNIKIGDFVELDTGMKGVVKGIHVRSTIITTLDNLDIIVPNSELVSAKVTNFTMNEPMFRIHIPFGVAYGSDKAIVEKAGLEAVKNVEVTYDDGAKRRPQVWLVGFGDNSLNFELIVWVVNKVGSHATPGSWKALYNWELENALEKYGITIPFPQRDLHIISGLDKNHE